MRFTTSQTSFKSGRLSPKLYNRVDTRQYRDGASQLSGFRVLPEGGATKLRGTRYINTGLDPADFTGGRLYTAQFQGRENLMSVRLRKSDDGGGNFSVIADVYNKMYPYGYQIYGVNPFKSVSVAFELTEAEADSTLDLNKLSHAVYENRVFFAHHSGLIKPFIVEFVDAATDPFFGLILTVYEPNVFGTFFPFRYPMGEFNSDVGKEIQISNNNGAAGTIHLTSTDPEVVAQLQRDNVVVYLEQIGSSAFGTAFDQLVVLSNLFYKADPGVHTNLVDGAIFTYTLSQSGQEAMTAFNATAPTDVFAISEWYDKNWPKSVVVHEGRVVYGGTPEHPLTLYGSKTNDPFYFNQTRYADPQNTNLIPKAPFGETRVTDPYKFVVASTTDSEITVLNVSRELVINTDRREYLASGGDTGISAFSINIKPQSSNGAYPGITATVDDAMVYVGSNRRRLFYLRYSPENGSYVSSELSILFNDLLENDQIKQLTYASHIKSLIVLMDSGNVYGITMDREAEVTAFYDTSITGVDSLVYIAAREDDSTASSYHRGDHVAFFVEGQGFFSFEDVFQELGVTESFIKVALTKENEYLFWDCTYTVFGDAFGNYSINGESKTNPDGLFPVKDELHSEVGNDFRCYNVDTKETFDAQIAVTNGNLVVNAPEAAGASQIVLGKLSGPKVIATMPVEAGQQFGTAQMGIKRIDEIGVRFYKSYRYEISNDGVNWQEIRVADASGNPTTSREDTKFQGRHDRDNIVYIRSTQPEPLEITGINMRGASNDG